MNFDAYMDRQRGTRTCTVLGIVFVGMKDLPFTLGEQILNADTLPADAQMALFEQAIDHGFGEGAFAKLKEQGMGSELLANLLLYMQAGYSEDAMLRLEEARKNASSAAQTAPPTSAPAGD